MANPEPHEDNSKPGQMSRGFNATVRDFDRAISLAKLSPTQVFIMQQARELYWSQSLAKARSSLGRTVLPDAEPFAFDVNALAEIFGCFAQVIRRNINGLMKMKILVRSGQFYIAINKDYRTWTREDGETLLSTGQVDFAKSGAAMGGCRLAIDASDSDKAGTISFAENVDPSDGRTKSFADERNRSSANEIVRPPPYGAGAGSGGRSGNFSLSSPVIEEKTPLTPQGGATTTIRLASTTEESDEAGKAVGQLVYAATEDEALAEALDGHARMLCKQYPAADVVASYASQCREKMPTHKWGNAVATNLANRARTAAQAELDAAPKPKRPAPGPTPRTPEQDDFIRRMKEAGI